VEVETSEGVVEEIHDDGSVDHPNDDTGVRFAPEEATTAAELTSNPQPDHDKESSEELAPAVVTLAPSSSKAATEIVTEMPLPSAGASVTLRKDEEGYVIEIHEPEVSAQTVEKEKEEAPAESSDTFTAIPLPPKEVEESLSQRDKASLLVDDAAKNEAEPVEEGVNRSSVDHESISANASASSSLAEPEPLTEKEVADADELGSDVVAEMGEVGTVTQQKPPRRQLLIHVVVKGDTLWHIAIRYLGDPFRYPELARLSQIRNPDLIYPGDKVRIVRYSAK